MRPQWILDLHPDFPSAQIVREHRPEAIVLQADDLAKGRWPELSGPAIGYGSMAAMTRLQRHPRLGQAVFDSYPQLRCSSYYRWIYDLLGRHCLLTPMSAVWSLPLERYFGSQVFLRSDSNFKLFQAEVHSTSCLPERLQDHSQELVVLSEVLEIECEYRCFCRNSRFICGSSYPEPPFVQVPPLVREFAETAASRLDYQGLNLCTVDVAFCRDGRLRLVEVGGVNSWGLYGAEPEAFLRNLEAEADERFLAQGGGPS
jgi:hypothetical protein